MHFDSYSRQTRRDREDRETVAHPRQMPLILPAASRRERDTEGAAILALCSWGPVSPPWASGGRHGVKLKLRHRGGAAVLESCADAVLLKRPLCPQAFLRT